MQNNAIDDIPNNEPDIPDNEPDMDNDIPDNEPDNNKQENQDFEINDLVTIEEEQQKEDTKNIIQNTNNPDLKSLNLIEFEENEGRKDILNYSKLVSEQRKIYSEIINEITSRISYSGLNEADRAIYNGLSDKIKRLFDLSQSFIAFFRHPPTQEEFEKINHTAIMQKALYDFRKFSDDLENLRLTEQSAEFSNEFSNFIGSTKAKLENIVNQYDDFLNTFIDKQKNHIEPFEKEFNKIVNNYDNSFAKILKIAKGGVVTLLIINVALVFIFGGLSATIYFQKEELDNIKNISKNFEDINVQQNKNQLIFEFEKDKIYKIFDEGHFKKIVIKTNKN